MMKYLVMWKKPESSLWHNTYFEDEKKAIEFWKELDCKEKNFYVKQRVGYSRVNINYIYLDFFAGRRPNRPGREIREK